MKCPSLVEISPFSKHLHPPSAWRNPVSSKNLALIHLVPLFLLDRPGKPIPFSVKCPNAAGNIPELSIWCHPYCPGVDFLSKIFAPSIDRKCWFADSLTVNSTILVDMRKKHYEYLLILCRERIWRWSYHNWVECLEDRHSWSWLCSFMIVYIEREVNH